MRNQTIRYFGLMVVAFVTLTACDNSALNVAPTDRLSDEAVWSDPKLIDLYLNDIYRGMHHGLDEVMLESLTDNSHFIHGYGTQLNVQGLISESNSGALSRGDLRHYRWDHLYSYIRNVNIMLQKLETADVPESFKNSVQGEALFLRAYFYHNLVRAYGGVPLITNVYNLGDDYEIARNTFAESIDFIASEADKAANLLPLEPRAKGRMGKGAALALKSRILTFAASDLFDNPTGPNPEITGYTSGSQEARYERAKTASKEVMDLDYYSLFNRIDDPSTNYEQLFVVNEDHEEIIAARFFDGARDWDDRWLPAQFNGPNGYRGWAGNTPIQSVVDAYEMADGTEFDWSKPEHSASPYENRDPRFYASILYDGAPWVDPPSFRAPYDKTGNIQTFEKVTTPNGEFSGIDTRNGPIEDWNGSYSRYYLRKFIDPSMPPQERQETPYIYFRYAEVVLNYVEANIGLGLEDEARTYLNMIRNRAGMPDITESGSELMQKYQNERRIELFGEEHRYFDVRRWMIAPEVMTDAYGITVTAEATDATDRSTYTNYTYSTDRLVQQRGWDDSHYFSPIPKDELNRNSLLVQNPGY